MSRAGTIDGVGVDTWGVDYGLISRDGDIIGKPFHYRDARNDGVMEQVFARLGRERLYNLTGVQFLQFNTLFQLLAHQRDDPGSFDRAERLLFMPDLLRLLLAGGRHTEPTIASTSQMYDPRRHAWCADLLGELRLPARLLPPIEPTGTISTSHTVDGCPVITTTGHDTAAAVVAVPAVDEGNWCYISSGTWSLMGLELDEPIINADSLRHNFTNEVGFGTSIRFLRNIMGLWLVQECRRDFRSEFTYERLTRLAAAARECDAVIDPDHKPFLAPGDMCAKIARFCRETHQSPPADNGQVIRCCLESLALTYRRTLERLEELTRKRIETIHIVGGGSRNELLNQMTADACERTVMAGPVEATAIGNLLVQAMALHAVDSLPRARRIVVEAFGVRRFDPVDPAPWQAKYARFREVAGA
jgi:rhamnulokinase